MTETTNRAQRRQQFRRAIKNREEAREERAASKKKAQRIDRQKNAQDINRSKALRAAGLEPEDGSFWCTVQQYIALKDDNKPWKTVTMLAVFVAFWCWFNNHLTLRKSSIHDRSHTWESYTPTIDGTKDVSSQMESGLMPFINGSF